MNMNGNIFIARQLAHTQGRGIDDFSQPGSRPS
jgi:hypothetical protein